MKIQTVFIPLTENFPSVREYDACCSGHEVPQRHLFTKFSRNISLNFRSLHTHQPPLIPRNDMKSLRKLFQSKISFRDVNEREKKREVQDGFDSKSFPSSQHV